MSGQFSTVWTFTDYLAANRLNAKLRGFTQWLIALVSIGTGVLVSNPFGSDLVGFEPFAVFGLSIFVSIAACAIGFWLARDVILPRQASRMFNQLKLDGVSTSFDFDGNGIQIASDLGCSNLEWSHITKWAEDSNILMFYRTNVVFFAVPKSQISKDTLDLLRQAIIAGGVAKAKV